MDIRHLIAKAISETGDPLAPFKLQDGHAACERLGKMLTAKSTLDAVTHHTERLLKDFTDEELDKPNPDLVIALCGCLAQAIVVLTASFDKPQ